MLMLDLWLQAETIGVTYFGAYNRPPDGHFLLADIFFSWLSHHEMSRVMKCKLSWNVNCHEMSIVIKCQMLWYVKYHEMLMLLLDLWLQAETIGVAHFGAYNRPPDGHFCTNQYPAILRTTRTTTGNLLIPFSSNRCRSWNCEAGTGLHQGLSRFPVSRLL